MTKGDNGLKDIDDAEIRLWFGKKYHINGRDKIWDCVLHECHRRCFHPVKNYLEMLRWDGKNRIGSVLIDYFGCEDCEYIREITKKTFLAA
ncbi:VapE family protein (plasmid) [Pyramidobacter sp. YE332]|uniref:VapE domain-containing protein n=1 Tax=Pyramidobacter sp. YE332 TaxID=3068894 RepID=UPI00294AB5DF|nr:VapE domain-containing protein [Pyramidobacter sp. YE332]WOL41349.1 VapE family protein [Pyramidobacter sp. YE332]